jgi:Zn-dependent protease
MVYYIQMSGFDASNPMAVFFTVLSILIIVSLVISLHEASHAFVANLRGDPTARLMGRMTINPLAHIDPLGTLVIPLILFLLQGPIFGWAKPTPINPLNFCHPRRDSALVAFAGPASNFALALVVGILSRLLPLTIGVKTAIIGSALSGEWVALFSLIGRNPFAFLFLILAIMVVINLLLGIFNLLPIPPLDGFKVLLGILPKEVAIRLSALEAYGPLTLIIFLLIFIQFLSPIISRILDFLASLLIGLP